MPSGNGPLYSIYNSLNIYICKEIQFNSIQKNFIYDDNFFTHKHVDNRPRFFSNTMREKEKK